MWRILMFTLVAGCAADTRFVRTDDRFTPSPAAGLPQVYFDALPPAPYRAVGIISVVVDVLAGRGSIASAAAQAGQHAGCAVVVERKLHQASGARSELDLPLMLATHGIGATDADGDDSTKKVEFVCGVPPVQTTGA
jgi:hypothetical protein